MTKRKKYIIMNNYNDICKHNISLSTICCKFSPVRLGKFVSTWIRCPAVLNIIIFNENKKSLSSQKQCKREQFCQILTQLVYAKASGHFPKQTFYSLFAILTFCVKQTHLSGALCFCTAKQFSFFYKAVFQ